MIVAPPTATSITPPVLPATYGTPSASTQTYQSPIVAAFEATYLSGYADARHAVATLTPTSNLVDDNGSQISPALPVDGTLQMTAITNAGD